MALHQQCEERRTFMMGSAWRRRLPVLADAHVTLRGLQLGDAESLLRHLATTAVSRHMNPPPCTIEGFQRFIRWTQAQRRHGALACFAVVPAGQFEAVGIIQIWRLESDFSNAEWGIAIGQRHWGRGLATHAAALLFNFAFETVGAARVEARAVGSNGRGRNLMLRLGATHEGTLRHSFRRGRVAEHHEMWAMLAEEWRSSARSGSEGSGRLFN
jgi:[ribosomal protein S5]-alanine N-acetyltransferase